MPERNGIHPGLISFPLLIVRVAVSFVIFIISLANLIDYNPLPAVNPKQKAA